MIGKRLKILMCCVAFAITLLNIVASSAQDTLYSKHLTIGDAKVSIHTSCYNNCNLPVSFINLHDDEDTSIEAAERFLADNGGNLIQLKHINSRTITFNLGDQPYTFDPNRIFSPAGIRKSLTVFGKYSVSANQKVTAFSNELIASFIKGKKLLIGLHNNSDSAYSILSYTKKTWQGKNASKVYINQNMDPDDFIYTTDLSIFNLVKSKEINVVLQNNALVRDDGSLSVYAARHKIPYINIEGQSGHIDEQVRMLEALKEVIYPKTK